jgi:hypothetical protein
VDKQNNAVLNGVYKLLFTLIQKMKSKSSCMDTPCKKNKLTTGMQRTGLGRGKSAVFGSVSKLPAYQLKIDGHILALRQPHRKRCVRDMQKIR